MLGNSLTIAETYHQFLVPLLFEPFAADLAQHIEGLPTSIVELACGTGITTQYIISKIPKNSLLYATDVNAEMLALAQTSIQDHRIEWQLTDAHSLPFPDQSMDVVICQFGVMFFEDQLKAFSEVNRILKHGGQFLFNTWDSIENNDISNISQQVIWDLFGLNAPDFSKKGPYSFFDQMKITSILQEVGFTSISIQKQQRISGNLALDDIVKGIIEGSPLGAYFLKSSIDTSAFKRLFREKLAIHSKKSQFKMEALVVKAKK